MPVIFDVIYLGKLPSIDLNEGDQNAENASALIGMTSGSASNPLFQDIQSWSPGALKLLGEGSLVDGVLGRGLLRYEQDDTSGSETFSIDGGPDQAFDAAAAFYATVDFCDGTSKSIAVVIAQDVDGNTYLVPHMTNNSHQANLEEKPIESITFDQILQANTSGLSATRASGEFDVPNGIVEGTGGGEMIDLGFLDIDGEKIMDTGSHVLAGLGADEVWGGIGGDRISGGEGADTLFGNGGADLISGDIGDDLLDGGADDDLIDGGEGDDTLLAGLGNDTFLGGAGSDIVQIGGTDVANIAFNIDLSTGTDQLGNTYNSIETVIGGLADDTLTGDDLANLLEGGGGDDRLLGGLGNDTLTGGDGSDFIDGGAGDDLLRTGLGQDTLFGGTGNDTLTNSDGDDSLDGGEGDDSIVATGGDDTLRGGTGDDTMLGGEDADTFLIEDDFGFDAIEGGETTTEGGVDDDTVDLSAITTGAVTVNFIGSETGQVREGGNALKFGEIERLKLTEQSDSVNATADSAGVNIEAGGGDDTIIGGTGGDTIAGGDGSDYIEGGGGDDFLTTGLGNDTLIGGTGDDTLMNSDGDDSLDGGEGNDSIVATGGDDTLRGGTGDDTMAGGEDADTFLIEDDFGNDQITGGEGGNDEDVIDLSALSDGVTVTYTGNEAGFITDGADTITFSEIERIILTDQDDSLDGSADSIGLDIDAGGGSDTLVGGDGNDSFDAGDGDNSVSSGAGDDTVTSGGGDDSIDAGDGADRVNAGDGNNAIAAGSGDDAITTGSGDDIILGEDGSDTLDGGAGADTIEGGSGSDKVSGGRGDDRLTGGVGDDFFTYTAGDGADTITDFNNGNTGAEDDEDSDFINLSAFYDNIHEVRDDFDDDGVLNQSNAGVDGADYSDNTQFQSGDGITFENADRSSFTTDNTGVICFVEGSRIATPRGPVPVECLQPGDMVMTRDGGPQPIVWTGRRRIGRRKLASAPDLLPIRLAPALCGGTRPLLVSPQHGVLMFLGEKERLVRARHLAELSGGQARVLNGRRAVVYHHFLLPQHDIVFAEGLPCETFYPGAQALRMLKPDCRAALFERLPGLATGTAEEVYGDPAHPFAARRSLPSRNAQLKPVHRFAHRQSEPEGEALRPVRMPPNAFQTR